MTLFAGLRFGPTMTWKPREPAKYALQLVVTGIAYFALVKASIFASLHSSTVPIWPPAGLALASVLLAGARVWPAIFFGALLATATLHPANVTKPDWMVFSAAIAAGNTIEALIGGYLIKLWSGTTMPFDSPNGILKFALLCVGPGAMFAAAVALGSLQFLSDAAVVNFRTEWVTLWLGDIGGAVVLAPPIVLWAATRLLPLKLDSVLDAGVAYVAATGVGALAFAPLIDLPVDRSVFGFLAALPLLWAALRCGPRDTATVAVILCGFAVWGALMGAGSFGELSGVESSLRVFMFMVSAAVPALVVSAHVAARKHAEAELRHREQNLRAIFSQAGAGIAQADSAGRFTFVNSRFCEIVQRPSAELMQCRMEDITDPDDVAQIGGLVRELMRTGQGFVTESRYVQPGGARALAKSNVSPLFDQAGTVCGFVAVAEDITVRRRAERRLRRAQEQLAKLFAERTAALDAANQALKAEIEQRKRAEIALEQGIAERRKTEEALSETEGRFRLLIQGVTDHAIFMLDPEGLIINWNVGAERIHHYAAAEIIGQHFGRFFTEEEQQRGEPERALQLAAYEGKCVAEGWRVRRDESLFWAHVVVEAIRDEAGTLVGYAQITRDITERREAQLALARAQEQLAQSQKMEALGQLTGSIAHDFNNLLMIVSGHAQVLRRRLNDPKQLQAIEAINSAVGRGEGLTRQLLAFSRRQPLSPIVASLGERIDAVHDMLVGSLRGNIQLKCDLPVTLWPVEVDIAELELALVNIAVNARDAMPGGGTITLSARNLSLKKSNEIDQLEGDFVALTITDSGVGIAPEILPRVFEPFFSTKPEGKGTGLGLSQVYGFAHQSGGTVVLESTVGTGTSITLYLRRSHRAPLTKPAEPPAEPIVVTAHGTVLIVEDNSEVADTTASLVQQLGYQTLRAENAAEALNQLQHCDNIDLVLSDIAMPGGMNGIALAQEIDRRYPHIPVVLNSAHSDMVWSSASRFAVLRKPFQLAVLEKSIREALERSGRWENSGPQLAQWRLH